MKKILLPLLLLASVSTFGQVTKPQGAFIADIKSCTFNNIEYKKGDTIAGSQIKALKRYDAGIYAFTEKGDYVLLQEDVSGEVECVTTTTGYRLCKGEDLKIGTGSMPSGDFKYIRINNTSFARFQNINGSQAGVSEANALPSNKSGHKFKVKRVENRGSGQTGLVKYCVFTMGTVRYEVDLENAISSGELNVPEAFRPAKANAVMIQQPTAADEILKYKKLLDMGAITQEEYDKKKAELLAK